MTSPLFKGYDPYEAMIKRSRANIDSVPERVVVKGLLCKENPTYETVDALEMALIELEQKKLEIERKRQELIKAEEAKKPLIFKFRGCSGYGTISFELVGVMKDQIKEIFDKHGARLVFNNEGTIHIDTYLQFEAEVRDKEPNSQFLNFDPIYQPYWKIQKHDKQIAVVWNPITNDGGRYRRLERANEDRLERLVGHPTLSLLTIPGLMRRNKMYTIPLGEGWRLYEIHPDVETRLCKWESLELIEEVKAEFEKRLRVKEIHTAEDSEVDYKFHKEDFLSRAHQRVAWEFQELVDHKAIIAYGTGTGKTSIGVGGALRAEAKRIVIVCPGALRLNWRNHVKELTGDDPLILAGRAPTKDDMKYLMKEHPKWVIINYDILRTAIKIDKDGNGGKHDILEGEKYFPWVELLNLYMPDYIIVDESHYVRNPSANQSQAFRQLEAPKKVCLSGTPLINRPGELWSVLNWLHPEQFPYYETFLNQYGYGRGIGDYEAQQLRSLLETIMIKRMRKDISKNLPPVNRIVETFEMSAKARRIYDRILMGIYEELAVFDHMGQGGEMRQFKSILPKLNAMIKVCAADKVRCTVERAVEISESIAEDQWNKVLIFTHFKGTCNTIARNLNIAEGLGEKALSFVSRTNTGFTTLNMEERMKMVHLFNTDPSYKYLVVTNGSAQEGLDITSAGVVIFNDLFWTPAAHLQCEGRPFYRESDMHGGDSYYFQFADSIEEWITELQGVKQNTIDKIVEGKGMGHSITNEIVNRLKELFKNRTKGK